MSAINPDHLLEQAERLVIPSGAGAPRQADLRRAISSAYYAVFHMVTTAAADQFIGSGKRGTSQYGLVYRATDHRALHDLCADLKKPTTPDRYRPHLPRGGFDPDFIAFASALVELQVRRHTADYDPGPKFTRADAELAIKGARSAIGRFSNIPAPSRLAFLTLLAFRARKEI